MIPIDPQFLKLGKRAVRKDPRTLKLANYLTAHLPLPPVAVDWTMGQHDWGMMLNDELGDCTIAACGHAVQVWTGNTTGMVTEPDPVIEKYYGLWDGYNPADPSTDQGGIELDVLNSWRKQGFDTHGLLAYVAINPRNTTHIRQAIQLFGGVYIGVSLPLSAQTQLNENAVWDVVRDRHASIPGSWGGHAVFVPKYDAHGQTCITWGGLQEMTWPFVTKYMDECYALLSADWLKHFAPGDAVLKALQNDLKAVTG